MVAFNVDEAAKRFHELIDRVARGEAVVIERDGLPIARMMSMGSMESASTPEEEQARATAAIESLRRLRGKLHATPEDIREWISWGRK